MATNLPVATRNQSVVASDETIPIQRQTKIKSIKNHGRSSSSSLDSTGLKNSLINDGKPEPQSNLTNTSTTTPSTTTTTSSDSELDSDQENQISPKRKKSKRTAQDRMNRRIKRFQKLFNSEIKNEMPKLIDSYVCAFQGKRS